jgi:hypothetical protein
MHIQSAYSSLHQKASFGLVFPSLSYPHVHVPAAAKTHAVTGADPTISLNLLEESMHATLERDTPAVVFRSRLFSRLLFESTRRITTTLRRKHGFLFPSPGRPAHTKLLHQIASGNETIAGSVYCFLDRKSRPSRSGAMGSTHSTRDQSRHS